MWRGLAEASGTECPAQRPRRAGCALLDHRRSSALLRAQGARTGSGYKTQSQVAIRPKNTRTVVTQKVTGWK